MDEKPIGIRLFGPLNGPLRSELIYDSNDEDGEPEWHVTDIDLVTGKVVHSKISGDPED